MCLFSSCMIIYFLSIKCALNIHNIFPVYISCILVKIERDRKSNIFLMRIPKKIETIIIIKFLASEFLSNNLGTSIFLFSHRKLGLILAPNAKPRSLLLSTPSEFRVVFITVHVSSVSCTFFQRSISYLFW